MPASIDEFNSELDRREQSADELGEKLSGLAPARAKVKQQFERAGFYPKVSIVIPVYNGANYMREAIDSALTQTYGNIEVIVVNDGSRDDGETDRIARSYGDLIRYFEKPNGGVATALNLGIEKMEGEYFSWLSHDDMYTPEKIQEEVHRLISAEDRTAIVAEGYQVVNSDGEYQYTVNIHSQYAAGRLENPLFLLMRGGINGCALLIHKSHFERAGLFDPALPTTQDYDLWFRMLRGQTVYYMKSSNVLSRSHEAQGSKAFLEEHVKECDTLWIGMMNSLTAEEKKAMSGSEYTFYHETAEFLKSVTGYRKAIQYAEGEMCRAAAEELGQTHNAKALRTLCDVFGYRKPELLDTILPLCARKSEKPRIVFYLLGRYQLGGLNRIVLQVAGMLAQYYDVIVTTATKPTSAEGYPTPSGVTEVYFPGDPLHGGALKLVYLAHILRTDVIVNSYNCSDSQLQIYEAAQHFGIHTIAWNHEFFFLPYWRTSLYSCLPHRDNLKKADIVLWLNSFSAQAYHALGENGIVMPNPNPFAGKIAPAQELPEDLLAIARFDDSRKGLEDLLRMFRRILDARPDTHLWIVGFCKLDDPIPSDGVTTYRELIQKLQLPEASLRFEGEVSNVEAYYQKACIHILPSRYEGFGLTILEAATMGLPSVVYSGSGMDDIITSGVDGCTVAPGNWEALADAALELLENPALRASMSDAAIAMTQRYTPERIANMWIDVIDAILKKEPEECAKYLSAHYAYRPSKDPDAYAALAAREYEHCISNLLENSAIDSRQWQIECEQMQQSLSWRITKPLRLVKKSFILLKREGFAALLKKVRKKLLHQ